MIANITISNVFNINEMAPKAQFSLSLHKLKLHHFLINITLRYPISRN